MGDSELRERLESAQASLRGARFDEALAQVGDWPEWPGELGQFAALVVADAKIRRDSAQALAFLAPLEDLFSTPEGMFRRELTLSRAYGIVRNFDAAATCLERASALLPDFPEGEHQLAYYAARLRYWQGDIALDDPDMLFALTDPKPSGRAAAYALRAWTHARCQDYQAQIADLIRSLDTLFEDPAEQRDTCAAAVTTVSLMRVAFETANGPGVAAAVKALEAIPWTSDTAEDHMHVLRFYGLDAFMRGEPGRAQWLFRDALALAPSPAYRALCHLDRALVARIGGNEPWALDELFEAERESANVAWGNTFGEERAILYIFALMYARVDASRAHYYAAAYSRLGLSNVNPNLAMSRDQRLVGFELYARGCIEQTLGDKKQAIKTFSTVYATFSGIDHHYRAAMAAISLFELSGLGEWADGARRHVAAYGADSPLAAMLKTRESTREPAAAEGLTPFQLQLLRAIIAGATPDGLSRRFSRSAYTIGKQIAQIYDHFNVASLDSLRREAERKGVA